MFLFKRLAVVMATVVVGLLGTVAVSAPAQAAGDCVTDAVCVYTGANMTGLTYAWSESPYLGTCVPMNGSFDLSMSSFVVATRHGKIKFFHGTSCTGSWIGWYPYGYSQFTMSAGTDNWARSFLMGLA